METVDTLYASQLIVSILDQMEAILEDERGRIKWYNKKVNESRKS